MPNNPFILYEPAIGKDIINLMKHRHLTKNERDALHKPTSDWTDTVRGDRLKSFSSLQVDDIISKYAESELSTHNN